MYIKKKYALLKFVVDAVKTVDNTGFLFIFYWQILANWLQSKK